MARASPVKFIVAQMSVVALFGDSKEASSWLGPSIGLPFSQCEMPCSALLTPSQTFHIGQRWMYSDVLSWYKPTTPMLGFSRGRLAFHQPLWLSDSRVVLNMLYWVFVTFPRDLHWLSIELELCSSFTVTLNFPVIWQNNKSELICAHCITTNVSIDHALSWHGRVGSRLIVFRLLLLWEFHLLPISIASW